MTTRQPPKPHSHSEVHPIFESHYLTPDSLQAPPIKRNLSARPGPRIQTMPSEEVVGIYSYLDEDTLDEEYFRQTLEAIESGEFGKVPEEIINWYNSLNQDGEQASSNEPLKRYYCSDDFELKQPSNEYVDIDEENTTAPQNDRREESPDSIKRPKRFQKGERIDFLKSRLSQFLTNNFKGIKIPSRREESKRSVTTPYSTSEWSEEDRRGEMVYSNSFDNSTTSCDYIENPMRRLSTEVFISQIPTSLLPPRRDTFRSYLNGDEENSFSGLSMNLSRSLENVLVSSQSPAAPPKPRRKFNYSEAEPYMSTHLPIPSPPPRVSSRQKETSWNTNLTQEYIEPRAVLCKPAPPPQLPVNPRHVQKRASESDSGGLYILPKDTPPTPMPRFGNNSTCSIPVLSPTTDYNDPLDFDLAPPSDNKKPIILPKPFYHKSRATPEPPTKPVPAPKPKGLAFKKHVSPNFIHQNSPRSRPHNVTPREFRESN